MPKRICFITRYPLANTPNAEFYLPALAGAGYDLTVVAPNIGDSVLQKVRSYKARFIELPTRKQHSLLGVEWATAKALLGARFGGYDLLIVHSQSLSARAAIWLSGPLGRLRLIYHTMDYYDPLMHPWHWRAERRICRKADLYINAEFHRAYITKTAYRARTPTLVIPPNLPGYWPKPTPNFEGLAKLGFQRSAGDFVLSLHGGFSKLRMVPELLEAMRQLPEHIKLIMTGRPAQPDDFDRQLQQMNLAHRVVRVPRCAYQEMLNYSTVGDAGVLLYANNDLGNFFQAPGRMCEYLVGGLPLLASNFTGLTNMVRNHDCGEPVNGYDPADIARGIQVLEEKTRAGRYNKDYIRSVFHDHFRFELWEPVLLQAIDQTIKGKLAAPMLTTLPRG